MPEREKVLKGLECCTKMNGDECQKCPYSDECLADSPYGTSHLADDALALLKEHEAVKPFYEEGEDFLNYFMKHTYGRCGHCKAPLPALDGMRSKFCWMCGRQVKWE